MNTLVAARAIASVRALVFASVVARVATLRQAQVLADGHHTRPFCGCIESSGRVLGAGLAWMFVPFLRLS